HAPASQEPRRGGHQPRLVRHCDGARHGLRLDSPSAIPRGVPAVDPVWRQIVTAGRSGGPTPAEIGGNRTGGPQRSSIRLRSIKRVEMLDFTRRITFVLLLALATLGTEVGAQSQPDGQLTIAFDASIAPSFLDPAETTGLATPFVFLYALHDALAKPLPGNNMAPCLAESW